MKDLFDIAKINAIKSYLAANGETLSIAESVTAGMLQLAFASAEFAAKYFQGGITTYNLGQKARHLMVNPIHAAACNCVSQQVACEMALNVCRLFSSDWGIGITGYASPVPEAGNELFCYFAISHSGEVVFCNKVMGNGQTPIGVQQHYTDVTITAACSVICR